MLHIIFLKSATISVAIKSKKNHDVMGNPMSDKNKWSLETFIILLVYLRVGFLLWIASFNNNNHHNIHSYAIFHIL